MSLGMSLKLDSALVTPQVENYRLPEWPPPSDFPVVIDAQGRVVSRYADSIWDLTPYKNARLTINFGDGSRLNGGARINAVNARLMRQMVAWLLFSERPLQTASSVAASANRLRPLFALCSESGISASDLVRYPKVAEQLPSRMSPANYPSTLSLLHELYVWRDQVGFTLLDREGLRRFEAALPRHESRQTPYIPPRIWRYKVQRLRAFLDDFHAHQAAIEACYHYCLEAYAANYGSLAAACAPVDKGFAPGRSPKKAPFSKNSATHGVRYYGPFAATAERFGIAQLLERWCLPPGVRFAPEHRIRLLANYFTQVGYVGTAYLLSFSGMRIEEGLSLRSDCLKVEHDERLGTIYLLKGTTTKTAQDDDALWVTSPSAVLAVKAMACISRLRMVAAAANPSVPTTPEILANPPLRVRPYEPWGNTMNMDASVTQRLTVDSYSGWRRVSPNLFDPIELHITEEDLQIAKLITPTLNPEDFAAGCEWPITWHQLRRTAAVNMASSGLVSDASLQYQLKHLTRAMSLYYGQGYSQRPLNRGMKNDCIRTVYEMLGHQLVHLGTDRYRSPLGESHKANMLKSISEDDHKSLLTKAKNGLIAYRETLFGGCMKRGACEYGGIDNVVHCGGGMGTSPCPEAIIDRSKRSAIETLGRVIRSQLVSALPGTPLQESLAAQKRSVDNVLNVLETN